MCGICGFTGRLLTSEEILENMMNKIIHRGPDSGGKHIDDGVSMGFRRLSIIDLEGGTQPIYNENRDMVITFNGKSTTIRNSGKTLSQRVMSWAVMRTQKSCSTATKNTAKTCCPNCVACSLSLSGTARQKHFLAQETFSASSLLLFHPERKSGLRLRNQEHSGIPRFQTGSKQRSTGKLSHIPVQRPAGNILQRCIQTASCPLLHFQGRQNGHQTLLGTRFRTRPQQISGTVRGRHRQRHAGFHQKHKISDVEVGSFLSSGVDSSYVAASFHGDKTFTVGFDYEKYNEIDYAKALSEKSKSTTTTS